MHTTLVTPALLAQATSAIPRWTILDIRHDLMHPERWGEDRVPRGSHPRRGVPAPRPRPLGAEDRTQRPPPAAVGVPRGRDVRARGHRRRRRRSSCTTRATGMYASRAWWMLRWLGHRAVALLDGGFDRWVREGRPVTTDVPSPRETSFTPARPLPVADAREILASLPERALAIVDARMPRALPRRGRAARPGRRPHSRRDQPALHREPRHRRHVQGRARRCGASSTQLLGDTPLDRVVHQCGSGVTSCHNLLAMAIAGFPGHAPLSRLVERVGRRSDAAGRARTRLSRSGVPSARSARSADPPTATATTSARRASTFHAIGGSIARVHRCARSGARA